MRGKRIEEALRRIETLLKVGEAWQLVAQELVKENRDLRNRVMSKSYGEYAMMECPGELDRPDEEYDPKEDSGNAGMVLP